MQKFQAHLALEIEKVLVRVQLVVDRCTHAKETKSEAETEEPKQAEKQVEGKILVDSLMESQASTEMESCVERTEKPRQQSKLVCQHQNLVPQELHEEFASVVMEIKSIRNALKVLIPANSANYLEKMKQLVDIQERLEAKLAFWKANE